MRKVYCENCRYVKKIEIKDAIVYYCPLPIFLLKDADKKDADNTKYNCKYYKKKWWKFWIREDKRKILKGAQPKTKASPKPNPRLISYIGLRSTKKEGE